MLIVREGRGRKYSVQCSSPTHSQCRWKRRSGRHSAQRLGYGHCAQRWKQAGVITQCGKWVPLKPENRSFIPTTLIKSQVCWHYLQSQHWEGEDRSVPGVHRLASLITQPHVPGRAPASKTKTDGYWGKPQVGTCVPLCLCACIFDLLKTRLVVMNGRFLLLEAGKQASFRSQSTLKSLKAEETFCL